MDERESLSCFIGESMDYRLMLLKYYVFLPRVLSLKVDGIPLSNSLFYYESLELFFSLSANY